MTVPVWIYFAVFVFLLFIDTPISFSMLISSALYCLNNGVNFSMFANTMGNAMASWTMLAVPTFIFVGSFMNTIGLSDDIFKFAKALVGHKTGGLAHANVLASMIFAGMSGSAIADAGGLGQIEVKAMTDAGYDDGFSAAITATSAGIGPIIPPSISFVIYGSMASVSTIALFMAGYIPGILMGVSLMVMCFFMAKKNPTLAPKTSKEDWHNVLKYGFKSLPALGAPVILIGGMLSGIFTATEAGVVASVYVVILSLLYRTFTFKALFATLKSSLHTTAMVLFMMGAGQIFNWFITTSGLMKTLVNALLVMQNPYLILVMLDITLLFMGCFMGGTSILLLMTPLLINLSISMGFDLLHLGVVLVLTTMIGGTTPPMAPALFTTCKCCGIKFEKALKPTLVLLIPLFIVLIILTFVPETVTFLPKLIGVY